jgi:hypothetical protein
LLPAPGRFSVAKEATIVQDAAPAKLADLKAGHSATLTLDKDVVAAISVEGGTPDRASSWRRISSGTRSR